MVFFRQGPPRAGSVAVEASLSMSHQAPTNVHARPTPPTAVGRYNVLREVGRGAMGTVFLSHDPELERDVAVKLLREDARGSSEVYRARFRNEARAAARFIHPHVVSVHDAGSDPTHGPYVVYEYVAGRNLRAVMDLGPLSLPETLRVARGIASALDALHGIGIVHRDIKPDNVLVGDDGSVKLTDLGIARVPDAAMTREGQFLGTPAYAPPEAISRGEYSPQGDVFSLAVLLYEALTGCRAFPGDDAMKVSWAVVHFDPPAPTRLRRSLPAAVDAVFAQAFSKRPSARPASAVGFVQLLAEALKQPRSASSVARSKSSAKRGGSGRYALAAVLTLGVVAAIVAFGRSSTDPSAETGVHGVHAPLRTPPPRVRAGVADRDSLPARPARTVAAATSGTRRRR